MLTTTVMTMLRATTLREVILAHVTQAILELAVTVLVRNIRHVCTLSPYIVEIILAVLFVLFLFLPDFFFFPVVLVVVVVPVLLLLLLILLLLLLLLLLVKVVLVVLVITVKLI